MPNPTQVTRSRFEITQDGQTSYLEFETDDQTGSRVQIPSPGELVSPASDAGLIRASSGSQVLRDPVQGWLTLWHTEVPEQLRGRGLALELVTTAFQYAKDHSLKVDVLCPVAKHILETHPEFQSLVHGR